MTVRVVRLCIMLNTFPKPCTVLLFVLVHKNGTDLRSQQPLTFGNAINGFPYFVLRSGSSIEAVVTGFGSVWFGVCGSSVNRRDFHRRPALSVPLPDTLIHSVDLQETETGWVCINISWAESHKVSDVSDFLRLTSVTEAYSASIGGSKKQTRTFKPNQTVSVLCWINVWSETQLMSYFHNMSALWKEQEVNYFCLAWSPTQSASGETAVKWNNEDTLKPLVSDFHHLCENKLPLRKYEHTDVIHTV